MKHSFLIQLCGLVTLGGSLAATTLGLLYVLQAGGITLDFTAKALLKGHYENPVANMLLVGVLAAIAALHIIQSRYSGRWGALASIAAFAGVALVVAGNFVGELVPAMASVAITLLIVGVFAASIGIVGLGIVTLNAGVLPKWCGIALIVGSPPGVGVVLVFSTLLVLARIVPGEIGWALAGIPWVLLGYAVFRAGSSQQERPSRVR